MTLSEFKAWFDGFTEDMDGPPSEKQWKRIKARVKEITGAPITERVFIERYRDYYPRWIQPNYVSPSFTVTANSRGCAQSFNGETAMLALGKAEALAS